MVEDLPQVQNRRYVLGVGPVRDVSPVHAVQPHTGHGIPERRGCQVSVLVGNRAREIHAALSSMGIVTDFRAPDVLRVAPVPLYNSFADVYGFVEGLERALSAGD